MDELIKEIAIVCILVASMVVLKNLSEIQNRLENIYQMQNVSVCWELNSPNREAFEYCVADVEYYHN